MKRHGTRVLMFAVFALTLSAGVVAGLLASRMPAKPVPPAPADASSLADALQLAPGQREQMRQIWEGVRDTANDCYTQAQKLEQQREDDVQSLLPEEKKPRYREIQQAYTDHCAALKVQREAEFDKAVERTKQMLNPGQRDKYEQILKSRVGREPAPPRATAHEQVATPPEAAAVQ
jgi:hypothetical protein